MKNSASWLAVWLTMAVFAGYAAGQNADCTAKSFPNNTDILSFLDGSSQGTLRHQRYVAEFFQTMESLEMNCSAQPSGRRSGFQGISRPMFAKGVPSRILSRQETFAFNNARTLVNLLANSPPSSSVSGTRTLYCFAEDTTGCTDCNVWFTDLFLQSLVRSTLESQTGITAAGVCFRTSPTETRCWDATHTGTDTLTDSRVVRVDSCSESWLWQKPQEVFNAQVASDGFRKAAGVSIVPNAYYEPSVASYYTVKGAGTTVPVLASMTSSWSTLHSQCYPSGATQWVLIHTTPVVANCSMRLVAAGLCQQAEINRMVMVGSSWASASINNAYNITDAYNITQCPSSSNASTDSVFTGSAPCDAVAVPSNGTQASLQCINIPRGFTPNSYVCVCPDSQYLAPNAVGNITELPSAVKGFQGVFIASHVGPSIQRRTSSACLACQPGCRSCTSSSPCLRKDNFGLKIPILVIDLMLIFGIIVVALFIVRHRHTPIIRSGSPFYLLAILISALVCSLESIVLFPRLNDAICALQPWPRHLGFITLFGFIFAKVWRVQILGRMPPGRVLVASIDRAVQVLVYVFAAVITLYLILWTAIGRSKIEIVYDDRGQSYEMCSVSYWRYVVHGLELLFLLVGCVTAYLTRKLVLEWPEFKFLVLVFANATIIKGLIAIFYFTLMPNKYPDYLYLLQFFDNLFTITCTIIIVFGHKIYMVRRNKSDRSLGPTVPAKVGRKESTTDVPGGLEIPLQQLAESRQSPDGKRQECLDGGFFDIIFACFYGPLAADWNDDYYGNRGRGTTVRGTSMAGEDMPAKDSAENVHSGSIDAQEDSGLPYMGDEN